MDRSNEAQEITENIYIFATLGYTKYEGSNIWTEIYNNIVEFTKMNIKEHTSLSNRAIFKHLDILDYMKKKETDIFK